MYGNTSQEDQIIFLAPATQMKPVFVERIEGTVLQQNTSDQNRIIVISLVTLWALLCNYFDLNGTWKTVFGQ